MPSSSTPPFHPYHHHQASPASSRHRNNSMNNSSLSHSSSMSSDGDQSWRRPGKQFRERLLQRDGSNQITLQVDCSIQQYYQVADRVLEQFLEHAVDSRDELIDAYLIGSRLSQFLSTLLPTHPDYYSRDMERTKLRQQSQRQLAELQQYLEQVAQLLDREQHTLYVKAILERQVQQQQQQQQQETKQSDDDDGPEEQLYATIIQRHDPEETKDHSSLSSLQSSSRDTSRNSTPQKKHLDTSFQSDCSSKMPLLKASSGTEPLSETNNVGTKRVGCYDTKSLLPPSHKDQDEGEFEAEVALSFENDVDLLLKSPVSSAVNDSSSNPFDGVMVSPITPRHDDDMDHLQIGNESLEFQDNSDEQGFEQVWEESMAIGRIYEDVPAPSGDNSSSLPVHVKVQESIQQFEKFTDKGAGISKPSSGSSCAKELLQKIRENRLRREREVADSTSIKTAEESAQARGQVNPEAVHHVKHQYPVRYGNWTRALSPTPRDRLVEHHPAAISRGRSHEYEPKQPKGHRRNHSEHLETDESMEGRRTDASVERSSNVISPSIHRDLPSLLTSQSEPLNFSRLPAPSFETFDSSFITRDDQHDDRLGAEPRASPWKDDMAEQAPLLIEKTKPPSRRVESPFDSIKPASYATTTDELQMKVNPCDDASENVNDAIAKSLSPQNARIDGWKQRRKAREALGSNLAVSAKAGVSVRPTVGHSPSNPEDLRSRQSSLPARECESLVNDRGFMDKAAKSSSVPQPPTVSPHDLAPFSKSDPGNFAKENACATAWPEVEAFDDPPIHLDMSMSSIDSHHGIDKPLQFTNRRVRSDTSLSKSPQDCGSLEWKRSPSVRRPGPTSVGRSRSAHSNSDDAFNPFGKLSMDEESLSDPEIDASRNAFDLKLETMRMQQQQVAESRHTLPWICKPAEPARREYSKRLLIRQSSPTNNAGFDSTLNTWDISNEPADIKPTLIEKRLDAASNGIRKGKASPTAVGSFDDDVFWMETAITSPRRLYHHRAMATTDSLVSDDEYDLIHGFNESSQSIRTRGLRRIALLKGCVSFLRD